MRDPDAHDDTGATSSDAADQEPDSPPSGVEQLQLAALEAVQAARAVLDVAESMIREPAAVEALVQTVSAMARTATESFAGFAAGATSTNASAQPGDTEADDADPDDGTYQRIDVD